MKATWWRLQTVTIPRRTKHRLSLGIPRTTHRPTVGSRRCRQARSFGRGGGCDGVNNLWLRSQRKLLSVYYRLITLPFTIEIFTHISDGEKRARELLKAATAASYDDPDKAVILFHEAHAQIARTDTDQGIDVFLRLPRYLQEGGRADEGRREFNNLLTRGYPNMPQGNRAWYCMKSAVYDKMRLFLQREKRFTEAVTFGVLSIIYDIKAMLTERPARIPMYPGPVESWSGFDRDGAEQEQKCIEKEKLEDREWGLTRSGFLRETERLDGQLTKLLKRAKLLDRHDETLAVFCEWANAQPDADDTEYKKRFSSSLDSV